VVQGSIPNRSDCSINMYSQEQWISADIDLHKLTSVNWSTLVKVQQN